MCSFKTFVISAIPRVQYVRIIIIVMVDLKHVINVKHVDIKSVIIMVQMVINYNFTLEIVQNIMMLVIYTVLDI